MENLRLQEPYNSNDWLYEVVSDTERNFAKSVYLGVNADPWLECTNEEKLAWEEAHKPVEPTEEPEQ